MNISISFNTKPKVLPAMLLLLINFNLVMADDLPPLRLGALQFGTVNWELDVIKHHQLDKKYGIDLTIIPLGGKNATHVALQGGSVDVIVSDWLWVNRQRSQGRDYTLSPYSIAAGSLMVNPVSGINSLADLKDKKLGVAGGPVDKTWLLLRAYSRKVEGYDPVDTLNPSYAAPPLLNKLVLRGELDGVINFWHYTARLKAAGFKSILDIQKILSVLGIHRSIPLIGWVFSEKWAQHNTSTIQGLLQASQVAKKIMLESDQEWVRLRPLMKASDDKIFYALRDGFRAGIASCFADEEIAASRKIFNILAEVGGEKLVGPAHELNQNTFWSGFKLPACAQ